MILIRQINTTFTLSSDIGGTLYGPWMRYAILFSIAISQIGFVTAYTIFVAQNLQVSPIYRTTLYDDTNHFHRQLFPLSHIAYPTSPSCSLSAFSWSSFCHWRSSETLRSSVQQLSLQMYLSSLVWFISLGAKFPSSMIGAWRRSRCSILENSPCSLGEFQLR